jgi:hypothetical protein
MLGSVFAIILDFPSAYASNITGRYLIWPGILSFFIFDNFVHPTPKGFDSTRSKLSFMGGYFLLSGLTAQLCGAIFDLINFNG